MKVRGTYHQLEVSDTDRIMVEKEGTMLYLRVLDHIGVHPAFRLDIQCQSDAHAGRILEGIRGKSP
ncbi:MAG: hypothetical protein ACXABY_18410 [Candidatus Thorarchaeota archaeon]|jgi:hypothetical protein